MKKTILWIVATIVSVWILFWIGSKFVESTSADKEWPMGLGRIAEVESRFPETTQNASAAELMRLAAAAGIDIGPHDQKDRPTADEKILEPVTGVLGDWLGAQLAKSTADVDATPPALSAYLTKYQPQLDAVREHLLHDDAPVWKSNLSLGFAAPIPNLLGHMKLTRILVARSLEKSRARDAGAWDELHAAWNLNRGLWKKPTLIEILIALATTRMMNAAEAKAPSSEPAWYAEVRATDTRKAMLAANQAEAWNLTKASMADLSSEGSASQPGFVQKSMGVLASPYLRLSGANAAELMRRLATDVSAINQCDLNVDVFNKKHADAIPRWNIIARIALPNLGAAWQRLLRSQVELEGTERLQQIKRGETPTLTSRCSDGVWQTSSSADGTRTLRFTHEIPVPPPGTRYPLEYIVAK